MRAAAWLGRIATSFVVSFYGAFVLQKLWAWFIIPTFGIHELRFWNACGLFLVVGLVQAWRTVRDVATTKTDPAVDEWAQWIASVGGYMLFVSMLLATGAFYHWLAS